MPGTPPLPPLLESLLLSDVCVSSPGPVRTSLCKGAYKYVVLMETGVRAVPLPHDHNHVPHVVVDKMYPEVGAVNRPPLTPPHGAVDFSFCPRLRDLFNM